MADSHLIECGGFWFEQSGGSMAVYNQKPCPWKGRAPQCDPMSYSTYPSFYIARVDLPDALYESFVAAIDEWLRARKGEAA